MGIGAAKIIGNVLLAGVGLAGLWLAKSYSFLLFHALAELFSMVIAGGIFVVAWNSRRYHTNSYLTFLSISFPFVAMLAMLHMLAYKGMAIFPGYDTNLPTRLWIAMHYMQSASLAIAPLLLGRKLRIGPVLGAYAVVWILLVASIFSGRYFPDCFIEGTGLTAFKKNSEYVASGILLVAMGLLWWKREHFDRRVLGLLVGSVAAAVMAAVSFTFYRDPYGSWNWAGHCLNIVSFYLIYKAIIETGLTRPYDLLFRDVQQAKAAAESANNAKDRFLAILSHELRNPLNPILMAVSALEREASLREQTRQDLAMVRRNAELEARLIDDLLDMTRVAKGKLELVLGEVSVHELARQAVEVCREGADEKGLEISLELGAKRHYVRGDPARLQQVLWNLLRNAVKFTPAGGKIWLRTRNERTEGNGADESTLTIEVSDTGIGISPEVLPRIFNAFEQGGAQINRQYGGLGLGLAISKALVEMHGGSIAASSSGRGATFTIRLPALTASPAKQAAPSTPLPDKTSNQPAVAVLLVEDHEDTRRLMSRLLGSMNCTVQAAGSVEAAMQAARQQAFDLVVSDLGLPDGSGLELMRQLQAQYGLRGICLSGYGAERDVAASKEAGFLEHLTKPVDFGKLQGAIERIAAERA
ncbi:MAG TPA: MASE3 domain-containing protein [Tepidisphaeraceae bacterium]|nr:MASE3 domain-containing protein [Tepidisphaeraceae bacterium]